MPPTASVVEMIAGKGRAPVGEHSDQLTAFEVLLHLLLCEIRQAVAGQRRIENERGGVEHQLSIDAHAKFASALLELLRVNATIRGQAEIDATVGRQILRRARWRTFREVSGRPYNRH